MSITQKERKFSSATGLCDIVYRQWIPEEIRGAVVLVHGMSEHIARYDAFARYLAENGFLVSGLDLPAHESEHLKPVAVVLVYGFDGFASRRQLVDNGAVQIAI